MNHSFSNIVSILRLYSNRPVILFSDKVADLFAWSELRLRSTNIFYVKGNFLDLDHLKVLEIRKAAKILISSDLMPKVPFSDAAGLCLARILIDHYDRSDFIIELKDELQINFLNSNPNFRHIECPPLLQPYFASGNTHFSSMITGILTKVIYTSNWIHFFRDLIIPNRKETTIKQNKTVHCLRLSADATERFRFFG